MRSSLQRVLTREIGWWSVPALARWWLGELRELAADLVPQRLLPQPLVLEPSESGWTLRDGADVRAHVPAATVAAGGEGLRLALGPITRPVVVMLPRGLALSKRLRLPEAAGQDLAAILGFEIARHTPFTADRVYYRYAIRSGGGWLGTGAIEVELTVVPREPVDEVLRQLAGLALAVDSVVIGEVPPRERRRRSLVPPAGPASAWTPFNRGLAVAAVVMLAGAVASPLLAGSARLSSVDAEIARLRPAAEARLAEQRSAAQRAERFAALVGAKRLAPSVLGTLRALTAALPDDTYLTSLQLSGRELVIEGVSPAAARLARPLETSGAISKVEYQSQIRRDPNTGLEHFRLRLILAKPGS